ncbi:hypothetical protein EBI_26187 [Enterocytozoon bieneusi H348]|nr:hypothetical protein EBI_26187 [Enterocytozoon bieneusi H348]|eukprot:XP_002651074.1 hypothetical protein EBI_26187 [Enterocytozoon bieneusi H348]
MGFFPNFFLKKNFPLNLGEGKQILKKKPAGKKKLPQLHLFSKKFFAKEMVYKNGPQNRGKKRKIFGKIFFKKGGKKIFFGKKNFFFFWKKKKKRKPFLFFFFF